MRSAVALIGLLAVVACEGPTGPEGPAGRDGVANRLMITRVVNGSGNASAPLPAAVGTSISSPPAMSCYITDNPASGAWIAVADGYNTSSAYCGLVFSGGVWNAGMIRAPVGWTAAWVVTY